jgi:chromosome segregation ATPase
LQAHLEEATRSFNTLTVHSESETRRLTESIAVLAHQKQAVSDQNTQLQLLVSRQEAVDGKEHAAEREDLIRRLQQSETALEELNRHPLADYRKIGELEDLVSALRREQGQYEQIVANADLQRQELQRENKDLSEQVARYRQQLWDREHSNAEEQNFVETLKTEVATVEEENNRLKKEVRELNFDKQLQYSNLEKAETYIAALIDQIKTQTATPVQDESIIAENRALSNQRQVLIQ